MDCISNLPDGIIIHISSSLSTDEAASTSLLSKRWRNLFAFIPNLHFSAHNLHFSAHKSGCRQNFIDFVDRVLTVSAKSPIRRFTLKCRHDVDSAYINRWICNVLNRGVFDLDLDITARDPPPLQIFACKSLVILKLATFFEIPTLPEDVSLPALKTLSLSLFSTGFCNLVAFEKLIHACPLLEEFNMLGFNWELWKCSQILSRPSLKRLTLICTSDELGSMAFDYPNLVYLEYSSFIQHQYPVVNLASLVEAKIDLVMLEGDPHIGDPTNLIKGLRNVERLNLSSFETLDVFGIFHEAIPVFEKLTHLSITSELDFSFSASSLPSVLKKSPNLETLVIQGPLTLDESDNSCECISRCSCISSSISFCPVKILELTVYKGSADELEKMRYFLEEFSCLELVKVCVFAKKGKDKLQIITELLMLPRASSKCKIQVEFS